jgi:hypothetical protein
VAARAAAHFGEVFGRTMVETSEIEIGAAEPVMVSAGTP